jgi:hypothetical protein
MHLAPPPGRGTIRKIQFARMSIGSENTTRIPTTQSSASITVVHSGPSDRSPSGTPAASSDFIKQNRRRERDPQIKRQQQPMPATAEQSARAELPDSGRERMAERWQPVAASRIGGDVGLLHVSERLRCGMGVSAGLGARTLLAPAAATTARTHLPSRPGEFHPEPLTEPDLSLSTYPARATH